MFVNEGLCFRLPLDLISVASEWSYRQISLDCEETSVLLILIADYCKAYSPSSVKVELDGIS